MKAIHLWTNTSLKRKSLVKHEPNERENMDKES